MIEVPLKYDKSAIIQKLEERGFTHSHAEGIAEALVSVDMSEIATKGDLKNEIKDLELRLCKYLAGILIAHGPQQCSADGRPFATVALVRHPALRQNTTPLRSRKSPTRSALGLLPLPMTSGN